MKTISLLLVLSILSLSHAFAQKIRFNDSTNNWTVFAYSCGGDPYIVDSSIVGYNGDTVIHGIPYRKVRNSSSSFIREDTFLKKVYAIIPTSDTDTTEQVLYDYTLNPGDSLVGHYTTERVDSIDSVVINGIWHKIWFFSPTSRWGAEPGAVFVGYTAIEGIGCLNGPFYPLYPYFFEECITLTCFSNKGTTPPLSHRVSGYFDNTSSCELTYGLGVKTVSTQTTINIYPNPATTELTVSANAPINQVTISDLVGRAVLEHSYNSKEVHINIAALPTGVYFVKINGTEVRKFVKE